MKRSSIVVIVLALLAVGAGAWFLFWPHTSLPPDPLAAVPADSIGIVHIQVDHVLKSDAYKRLVVERGQAKGIERVQVMCGFNPLERLSEITVFARPSPGGGLPKIAFTARGDLRHEELIDCVKKFTNGDESALQRDDIEGIPMVHSKKGTSRAAFVGRDGVIGGDADSVIAAIQTVLGKAPSIANEPLVKQLYLDTQSADIALVTRLPDEAKRAIRQLSAVAGPRVQQLEQLKLIAVSLSMPSERIAGGATMITPSAELAQEIVDTGKIGIQRLLNIPGIGLTPASGVLRNIQTEARGDRATFTGVVKVSTLETLIELAPALGDFAADMVPGAANKPAPEPSPGAAPTAKPGATSPVPTVEPLKTEEKPAPKKKAKPPTE